jgi:Fic family protein
MRRMLEQDSEGFEVGMSATKHKGITKTFRAKVTRDLQHLVEEYS